MGLFEKLFGSAETSANSAKNRLKMVLVHDRNDISPGVLRQIRDDIIGVFAHHLNIDPDAVEVMFEESDNENMLVAQVPLTPTRRIRANH
ncbi:MAG: cell division topological specificity factor [Cellvibrionaceae bacterium]|jgi:cell division topological specificity factor